MQLSRNRSAANPVEFVATPKRVLCYGHDEILLHSRRRILEIAGCPVVAASNELAFEAEVCFGCPGVIVMCQTVQADEGIVAAALAERHRPAVPLLLIYIQQRKFTPLQDHVFFQAGAGPRAFAATVFQMLYHPGTASAAGLIHSQSPE